MSTVLDIAGVAPDSTRANKYRMIAWLIENAERNIAQSLEIDGTPEVSVSDTTCIVRHADGMFYAEFPLDINGIKYTLILSGNIQQISLGKGYVITGRGHPFREPGTLNAFKSIHREDILPGMPFVLIKDSKVIKTSKEFIANLRRLLPSTHPLGTVPTV